MGRVKFYIEGDVYVPFKCGCVLSISGNLENWYDEDEGGWEHDVDGDIVLACGAHKKILDSVDFPVYPRSYALLQFVASVWNGVTGASFEDFAQSFILSKGILDPWTDTYEEATWCTFLEELKEYGDWEDYSDEERELYHKLCKVGSIEVDSIKARKEILETYTANLSYESEAEGMIVLPCGCEMEVLLELQGEVRNASVDEEIRCVEFRAFYGCEQHEEQCEEIENLLSDEEKLSKLLYKLAEMDNQDNKEAPALLALNSIVMGTVNWEILEDKVTIDFIKKFVESV